MRVAQVALVITKGHGYTMDHPAQKWCREALFYRVHASDEALVLAQLQNLTE